MDKRGIAVVSIFLLCAVLLAVYWNGLQGQFFFDDQVNILAEKGLQIDSLTPEAFRSVLAGGTGGPSGRPVARLSFALNYFFAGFDPFFFKITNLAIHAATGGLVFLLAMHLFSFSPRAKNEERARVLSVLLATVWLIHPIQLLPVLHVVQRMTSLSAFFLLAGLLCHIRAQETVAVRGAAYWILAWFVFWPLSVFSKETGLLFPLFVLAWECFVWRSSSGRLDRFARWLAWGVGGATLLIGGYLMTPLATWLWAGYDLRGFSLEERLLTEGRVLWFYLGQMLLPRLEAFALFHDDFQLSHGLLTPWTTLLALLGWAAVAWFAWLARHAQPLVAFGIVWFMIGHGLESTVLPLEIAHEHRNYLPLFGVLLVVFSGLRSALDCRGPLRTLAIVLLVGMLTYFPMVTTLRAHEFGDEIRRSQIEAQHHRLSARAQHEAGRVLASLVSTDANASPAYVMAKTHYELAGELDPDIKMNWLGLINLNCTVGKPVEKGWIDEMSYRLEKRPFAPGDRTVLFSLKEMAIDGTICLGRVDVDRLFLAALVNPSVSSEVRAMLHSWHADYLLLREHDLMAARIALQASLDLVPGNASNRLKWAQLVLLGGNVEKARQLLLELTSERFSPAEKKTLDELLLQTAMLASKLEQNSSKQ